MAMENGSRTATQNRTETFGRNATTEQSIARVPPAASSGQSAEFDAQVEGELAESIVLKGDISGLSPRAKADYYLYLCRTLGLNPATQPIQFIRLNGKDVAYVTRGATDQLAKRERLNRRIIDGPKIITMEGTKLAYAVCEATLPNGRVEVSVATLALATLDMILMKVETKAKRRATLSILGLGMLDEVEVADIPASQRGTPYDIDQNPPRRLGLQGLRDDLDQCDAGPIALDTLRAIVGDHYAALAAEAGEAIEAAHSECRVRCPVGMLGKLKECFDAHGRALAEQRRAEHAAQSAECEVEVPIAAEHPAVTALREALDVAKSLDAVVSVWRQAGGEVKTLDEGDKFNAWTLAVEAVARINATTCEAADVALRGALAGPKGDGPKGTRKPATKPAADAQGSSAEAAPSAGPQARAPHPESAPYVAADGATAWAARVARYTNTIELRRSWERHVPAYRAAGVLEARRAVSVARLQALASIDDEGIAQRVLDDAERAADAAARVTSTARRTGRSEVTVRREARDAAERTLRKVA